MHYNEIYYIGNFFCQPARERFGLIRFKAHIEHALKIIMSMLCTWGLVCVREGGGGGVAHPRFPMHSISQLIPVVIQQSRLFSGLLVTVLYI